MTETSPLAAFGLPPARKLDGHDDMYYKVKAGRVVAGVEVRVVAEDGTILPHDGESVGEFEIRGPWVTGSYYKDEDPAKFHDGWLRTGDVGTLDQQGYMTISDRTKDVIKSGGEWISSVELENAVMAHPDVFEAAVIAVPDPKWSERPLVAVVPKPGKTPSPSDLVDFLAGRVPRWWLPDQWTFIERDPQDECGQIRQEGHAGRLRRRGLQGADRSAAEVSAGLGARPRREMPRCSDDLGGVVTSAEEAMADVAARLEGVVEELTDIALDALRRGSQGDPHSAEAGEAIEIERRIVRARRSIEKAVSVLAPAGGSMNNGGVD